MNTVPQMMLYVNTQHAEMVDHAADDYCAVIYKTQMQHVFTLSFKDSFHFDYLLSWWKQPQGARYHFPEPELESFRHLLGRQDIELGSTDELLALLPKIRRIAEVGYDVLGDCQVVPYADQPAVVAVGVA